jgi:integrase
MTISCQGLVALDTKTGRSMRPLSNAACDVLRNLVRSSELVFSATRGDGRMSGFPKFWARIAALGGLPASVTPHTLRHSFASVAGDLGYSELTIAALVGHKGRSITSRYPGMSQRYQHSTFYAYSGLLPMGRLAMSLLKPTVLTPPSESPTQH